MINLNGDIMEIIEGNNQTHKEMSPSIFKYKLRKKGIIPVLRDDKLFIYKVSTTEKLSKLADEYRKTMGGTHDKVYLFDNHFKEMVNSKNYLSYLLGFDNMLGFRKSTYDEIWKSFNLDDEQFRIEFLKNFGKNGETLEEAIKRISALNFVTCTFKRDSKIAAIIDIMDREKYIDLDFLASLAIQFLYSRIVVFDKEFVRHDIERMSFSDKEMSLSLNEKIELIKSIISGLDIKCVYQDEIGNLSDNLIESMFGTASREMVLEFAQHNALVLDDCNFNYIYGNAYPSKQKTKTKQNN